MDAELALVLAVLGFLGVVALGVLWVTSRFLRVDTVPAGIDPIIGARNPVAIHRTDGPTIPHHPNVYIPMPDRLQSQEEMVRWMTRELPRLAEEAQRVPTRIGAVSPAALLLLQMNEARVTPLPRPQEL